MKNFLIALLLVITLTGFYGCHPDNELPPIVTHEDSTLAINYWVGGIMQNIYLWNNQLPNVDMSRETNPISFFKKLLYPDDKWSYITSDFEGMMNMLNNTSLSYGLSFDLYQTVTDGTDLIGIVTYVVPHSPASEAGLKRGDVFGYVNGTKLTITNYNTLLSSNSYTLSLINRTLLPTYTTTRTTNAIVPREFKEDPILLDTIYDFGSAKVGYFCYTGFISSTEDSTHMVNVFKKFKAANIGDLVLDLRYNGGGSTHYANMLSSMIVSQSITSTNQVFYKSIWNANYNDYFQKTNGANSENLVTRFLKYMPVNLGLNKVYVLMLKGTASSSEIVINCLSPYMSVVKIGENSHGKYTAMIPFCGNPKFADQAVVADATFKGKTFIHNYGMLPIVSKTANANGYTDFKNGFTPDLPATDDYFHPLGDINEGMLATALSQISGTNVVAPTLRSAKFGVGHTIYQMQSHPDKLHDIAIERPIR